MASNVMFKVGLIGFPVSAKPALEDEGDKSFHTLCREGHEPVRCKAPLHCPKCSNDDRSTFVKGQEQPDGTYAIVTTDEIASTKATDAEKTELNVTLHPTVEIGNQTLPSGRVYYLHPRDEGEAYPMMVEFVRRHPEFSMLTTWAPRDNPALFRIGTFGDTLTLTELARPERLREAPTSDTPLNEGLLGMAEQFLTTLAAPFDPETYRDRRADMLREIIAKAETVTVEGTDEGPATAPIDLMAALQAEIAKSAKKPARKRAPKKKAS
jgi:DNA end-binding protein Ku